MTGQNLQPRMVVVDLDGTFLDENSLVSENCRRAAEEIARHGIEFVVASGRILSRFPKDVMGIKGINYAVTANGASVMDIHRRKQLYCDNLTAGTVEQILDIVFSYPIYCEIYSDNEAYTDWNRMRFYNDSFYSPNRLKAMNQSRHVTENLYSFIRQPDHKVEKIFFPHVSEEYQQAFLGELNHLRNLEITIPCPFNYEINKLGCNKAKGLKFLCASLKICPGEIMAFGDAENDSAMLRYAGLSVAMGNSNAELQRQAKFVTRTNAEDGVAWFLNNYVLL